MKRAHIGGRILSVSGFMVLLGALGLAIASEVPPIITQAALLEKLEQGRAPLILDVRTPAEYQSGYVPQALNIPHMELPYRMSEIADAKSREVVVYCERGPRAGFAESVLRNAGFSVVRHLEGDMYAWRARGLPMERP
ncbi:MAG: rhodanese-like domain-containing protein [Acidiferrobacterales bacterium]